MKIDSKNRQQNKCPDNFETVLRGRLRSTFYADGLQARVWKAYQANKIHRKSENN